MNANPKTRKRYIKNQIPVKTKIMPQFYTVTFKPSELKAILEFIATNSQKHLLEIRKRGIRQTNGVNFESAINKINNSKPVFIHK